MKMKYLALSTLLVGAGAQAAVILSNPASVPISNVVIEQSNSSGSSIVQARNRASNLSDWRAITQTFFWNGSDDFDGVGLHMGTGNNSYWSSTSTQTYQFVIQELAADLTPTNTVLNATFALTGDKVADGQWLFIDTDNVALVDGGRYGFSLAPAETAVNGGLRTFWNTADTDAYASGVARQYAPNTTGAMPKSDKYNIGGGVNDYTFYMQSIPEPASICLIGLVSSGILFIRRVFMV